MDESRVLMKYRLPLAEIITDFYDELKSRSSGYTSFDYEEAGYESSDLVKVVNTGLSYFSSWFQVVVLQTQSSAHGIR